MKREVFSPNKPVLVKKIVDRPCYYYIDRYEEEEVPYPVQKVSWFPLSPKFLIYFASALFLGS